MIKKIWTISTIKVTWIGRELQDVLFEMTSEVAEVAQDMTEPKMANKRNAYGVLCPLICSRATKHHIASTKEMKVKTLKSAISPCECLSI